MSPAYFLGARWTLGRKLAPLQVSRHQLARLATTTTSKLQGAAAFSGCSQTKASLLCPRQDQEFGSRDRARSYLTASSPRVPGIRDNHHRNIILHKYRSFSTAAILLHKDQHGHDLHVTHKHSESHSTPDAAIPEQKSPTDNHSIATLPSRLRSYILKLASHSHDGHDHGHDHSHSHGLGHHHHHEANPFLTSSDTTDAGVRITRIGLLVNILMAVFKGIGGWIFNSQALIADAFHSLTDLVADILTLSTVTLAKKQPNEKFPNGYGKWESLGSVGVSGILLVGGALMGYSSLISLYAEFFVENAADFIAHHGHVGHDHSHHAHEGPSVHAAWLAAGSILVKEWLYRATMKVAKERKSTVLASNAIHHRIDSLTSIVALLAIGGSHFLPAATYLDPIGGLIVSIMVVNAGWQNTKSAVLELADVGLDHDVKAQVTDSSQKFLATLGQSVTVKNVGGIKSGQNLLVEVELQIQDGMTMGEMHEIEKGVREVVGGVNGVRKVRVRFVGEEVESEFVEEPTEQKKDL